VEYSYELLLVELGARIKQLRKDRGWTLRDMVVQHDFHLTHWQSFENGKRGLSLPSLLRIAGVLDVPPSKLIEGLGEPTKLEKTRSPRKQSVKSATSVPDEQTRKGRKR